MEEELIATQNDGENDAPEAEFRDTPPEQEVNEDAIEPENEPLTPDYSEIEREDVMELKRIFPELRDLTAVTELKNPIRYAALRDLGLTAEEAYLATRGRSRAYDNRAHLTPTVPGGASVSREMSRGDYDMAREIFSDLSDAEIRKLYRKVTK